MGSFAPEMGCPPEVAFPLIATELQTSLVVRLVPDPDARRHSIVSSAVASSVGGISIPSCRAVFMLSTSS